MLRGQYPNDLAGCGFQSSQYPKYRWEVLRAYPKSQIVLILSTGESSLKAHNNLYPHLGFDSLRFFYLLHAKNLSSLGYFSDRPLEQIEELDFAKLTYPIKLLVYFRGLGIIAFQAMNKHLRQSPEVWEVLELQSPPSH